MSGPKPVANPVAFLATFEFEGAIDMVNLFKFRDRARYPEGSGEPERSGREAFEVYARLLAPVVATCGGCEPIWRGRVHFDATGGGTDTWDEMLVMRYPSRQALIQLLRSPEFAAIHPHRSAAISDSQTFVCTA